MQIQHEDDQRHSQFYIEEDRTKLAEIVYTKKEENIIVIEHTEVDERLRGQNVGYQLVEKVVEYARANELKILPVCSFAKKVLQEKSEFNDVLA